MDKIKLSINDFKVINEVDIEINKINIVGGKNSTGKSTVSKLLYCILKSSSKQENRIFLNNIEKSLKDTARVMLEYIKEYQPSFYKKYLFGNFFESQIDKHNLRDSALPLEENSSKQSISDLQEKYLHETLDYHPITLESIASKHSVFDQEKPEQFYISELRKQIKYLESLDGMIGSIFAYEIMDLIDFIEIYPEYGFVSSNFDNSQESSNNFIEMSDYRSVYFKNLYESEFDNIKEKPIWVRLQSNRILFNWQRDTNNIKYFDDFGVDYVFYMDPSLSDFYLIDGLYDKKDVLFDHMNSITDILDNLKSKNDLNNGIKTSHEILDKIDELIQGHIDVNEEYFEYKTKNNKSFSMKNTASGIRRLVLMQLLVDNSILTNKSYLIIDEPEISLHPEWQFKFAEILVLLVKELGVTLYINSHSPAFIESIDAFVEYYDMGEDVNYYLTGESDTEGKFNFTKIGSNELYKIYDSLGEVYRLVDQLRLEKKLME